LPYALALIAVCAVLVAKDLIPGGGDRPFLLLGAAVVVASYYGGRGPGVLATVAGAFAVDLLYLSPVGALSLGIESEAWLAAFGLEGLVITLATDTLRRARTEARAMASRERLAREAAEAALKIRDTFLSVASHELRTPLTTIAAATQLALKRAERGEDPQRVVEALQHTMQATRRLEHLMGNVMDLSQLQRGGLVLKLEEFDLVDLVREVAEVMTLTVGAGRRIEIVAPETLIVSGDRGRLEQVTVNLLDNAIKYSPGTDTVDVVLKRRAGVAHLSVRDHGVGIAPEARERIFEAFHRERPGEFRGMGLGLSVVREVVRLHGGDVTVQVPADGGSIFEVTLPAPSPA
jgi:signal transduction histidine kinase